MAIFRDMKPTTTEGVADTTLTMDLPVYQEGDWLFALIATGNAAYSSGMDGWAQELNQIAGTATRALIYKKKAGASETPPSITLSTSITIAAMILSFPDGDPTNIIDDLQYINESANSTSHTLPAATSTVDGAMILDILMMGATTLTASTLTPLKQVLGVVNTDRHISVRAYGQVSAGAIASGTMYSVATTRSVLVRIVLKNKTAGRKAPIATGGPTIIKMGGPGDTIAAVTNISTIRASFQGINTDALTTLTVNNLTTTVSNGSQAGIGSRVTVAPPNNGVLWYGFYFDVPDLSDFSGLVSVGIVDNFTNIQQTFSTISIYLEDGSGNWGLYFVGHRLVGPMYMHISDLTVLDSSGTINLTDIVRFGHCWKRVGTGTSSKTVDIAGIVKIAPIVMTGYVRPRSVSRYLTGYGLKYLSSSQGELQEIWGCSVQIGDGTNPTVYESEATHVEMPFGVTGYNQKAGDLKVIVKAASGDTISFAQSVMSGVTQFDFTIDPNSSTSATYSGDGSILRGAAPTWKSGITNPTGRTFIGCSPVDAKGVALVNCSILKTLASSSQAAVTFDANSSMSGTTIDVTGTSAGYHIELGESVTAFTLTDVTFTGTPGTDKIHVLATTGTVTITAAGTTSLVAGDITSEGADVVLVSGASVTVSGLVAGSEVRAYVGTPASNTLLDSTESSGTSFTFSHTETGNAGFITIRKTDYVFLKISLTYAGTDTTIPVQQQADRVYANPA